MKATGKPFVVLINSANPTGKEAKALQQELQEKYGVASWSWTACG